jgi:TetR/AcrR family transcriptional repressor of lmrAB and yxaGH operons
MAKASDSKGKTGAKEKTLAAAAKLFSQRGYHGTALHDILGASGAPRGSLYFHFPSGKEEIGEGALALGAEAVRAFIAHAAATSQTASAFVSALARGMAANLEGSGYCEGCPVATIALETAAQIEALGGAARTAFESWEREIKHALVRFGMKAADADRAATAILAQLEGALLLSRTYRSLEPMRRAEKALALMVAGKAK